ncbi:MAG: hypothetical protein HKN23_17695 [Verrucomicrobiales bacterium]|nr:hypothetical protein [Verrucomicrobiales bacterium]
MIRAGFSGLLCLAFFSFSGCGGVKKARAKRIAEKAFEHSENGDYEKALSTSDIAVSLGSEDPKLYALRGMLFVFVGEPEAAAENLEKGIEFAKALEDDAEKESILGRMNSDLAAAYRGSGQYQKALEISEANYEQQKDDPAFLNNYAWFLAVCPEESVRDGEKAVKIATAACELSQWEEFHIIDTLAAAYAEAGNYENAVRWQKRAIQTAKNGESPVTVDEGIHERLKLYESGKPFREDMEAEYREQIDTQRSAPSDPFAP